MHFSHSTDIWRDFPELAVGVLSVNGITPEASAAPQIARFNAIARSRLAACAESDLPEIQAWRRVFSKMGLKPTQYRCAAESLLRRFRKENALPPIHPLVDLCNAVSLAFAIPVAVFDVARVADSLEVRYADGTEAYAAFSGEIEHPARGEIIFADRAGQAHARRWTHRQSALSAIAPGSAEVLIVAEAHHASGKDDVQRLVESLAAALAEVWAVTPVTALLTASAPRFDC
jgi:DNA/RNA-binding domain of Phe-tRNA-synthetase-like protein